MKKEDSVAGISPSAKVEFDRQKRTFAEMRRATRARHRRCFWTRPFGHRWAMTGGGYGWEDYRCVSCEKPKRKWIDA